MQIVVLVVPLPSRTSHMSHHAQQPQSTRPSFQDHQQPILKNPNSQNPRGYLPTVILVKGQGLVIRSNSTWYPLVVPILVIIYIYIYIAAVHYKWTPEPYSSYWGLPCCRYKLAFASILEVSPAQDLSFASTPRETCSAKLSVSSPCYSTLHSTVEA